MVSLACVLSRAPSIDGAPMVTQSGHLASSLGVVYVRAVDCIG